MGRGSHGGMGEHRSHLPPGHTLADNLPDTTKKYPLKEGYFGTLSHGIVRHIESSNPITTGKDFYDRLTAGAIERKPIGTKGEFSTLRDGNIVSFRPKSSSDGSPAADINIVNPNGLVKKQKIHFIQKEKNK